MALLPETGALPRKFSLGNALGESFAGHPGIDRGVATRCGVPRFPRGPRQQRAVGYFAKVGRAGVGEFVGTGPRRGAALAFAVRRKPLANVHTASREGRTRWSWPGAAPDHSRAKGRRAQVRQQRMLCTQTSGASPGTSLAPQDRILVRSARGPQWDRCRMPNVGVAEARPEACSTKTLLAQGSDDAPC